MKKIIYQVLPRLFGNGNEKCVKNGSIRQNGCGKLANFTPLALKKIKELGANYIWYTGIIEHATQTDYSRYGIQSDHPAVVKGKAGSPYAIKDYYDVDPDLAMDVPERILEFESLVDRTHQAGLKMIIDFVPNHVARQYHSDHLPLGEKQLGETDNTDFAFNPTNNFYYIPCTELQGQFDMQGEATLPYHEYPAKATGNDKFDAYPGKNDWYETVKLNYGIDYVNGWQRYFNPVPDTWHKMLHILLFWANKKIDGFRCDMAEMVPVEFWEWAVPQVKTQHPGIEFIAEVYNPAQYRDYIYRGHFDYLYDKVGLYDTLFGVIRGTQSAADISRCWQQVGDIQDHMLNFLENHDELRIASRFFADNPQKAIPALVVSACLNTNPMMIYAGQELGESGMDEEGFSGLDGRTTIFDYWSPGTLRRWYNGGTIDGKKLTKEEKQLQKLYARILNLCNSEAALRDGKFFDLTYANVDGWRYDARRQYSFVRKDNKDLIFIVVNFDDKPVDIAVNLPIHLFEYFQLPEMDAIKAHELLTNKYEVINFSPRHATDLLIPAYSAKLLKIKM
ncbi:MAG: alpha-amylase family protein [Bacteroidaceae bacterium]|nr:alpha-amylase family protein [Bacteroidaceae bacterium]